MATLTTTYSFSMPLVGGDADVWGAMLNDNWDDLDTRLTATFEGSGAGHLGTLKAAKMPPLLNDTTLSSTAEGAAVGPTLTLLRNSASPADNDVLGEVVFSGKNDAAETVSYARVVAKISDMTDTTENGSILFQVAAPSLTTVLEIDSISASFSGQIVGDGSGITGVIVNASNITSGTLENARLNATTYNNLTHIAGSGNAVFSKFRADEGADVQVSGDVDVNTGIRFPSGADGTFYLTSNGTDRLRVNTSGITILSGQVLSGDGSGLTDLDATALTGTINISRFPDNSGATDWVLGQISDAGHGAVGTYASLRQNSGTDAAPGDNKSGSIFTYSAAGGFETGGSPSGTWKCMGRTSLSGPSEDRVTTWLRIS